MLEESNTKKVVKGLSSQTLVTLVNGVLGIIVFSIMSRLLSQEDFGYYAAVTAITTIFDSLTETGVGAALIQKKDASPKYINNAFTISIIFGIIISLVLFIMSGWLAVIVVDDSMKVPLRWISLTLFCNCVSSVNLSLLQKQLKFLTIGIVNLLGLVISGTVCIVLAYYGFGFYAILTRAVLTAVVIFVFSFIFARPKFRLQVDWNTTKSIFGFSGWLMASALFRNFAQQVDRLLMSRTLSVSALGIYNRPKEFITMISAKINTIFDTVLFPVLSGIQDNKEGMKRSYRQAVYYLNVFSMLFAITFIFNSELIIRIFFGQDWMNVKTVFILLSIALVFNIDGRLSDCYLRSLALTKQQFFFRIIELVIKTIGFFIGAIWGVEGVAVSVVTTNFIMIAIKFFYISRKINITAKETISILFSSWKYGLFVAPLMTIICYVTPSSWIGNVIVLISYLLIIIICFAAFPQLIGSYYKEDLYIKIKSIVLSKLRNS